MNFSITWHFIDFIIAWHYEWHVIRAYNVLSRHSPPLPSLVPFLLQPIPVLFHFQVCICFEDPMSFRRDASWLLGEGLFTGSWVPYQRLHH